MLNCIYADNSVIGIPEGPCAPVNEAGSPLIYETVEENMVNVTTPAPINPLFIVLGLIVVAGLFMSGKEG